MKDILIVEDGKPERERLEKLLGGAGYSVKACESVGEAEKTLAHEDFRLAIIDIGLNDKSGSYLFDSLKRSGKVSAIIIFTGNPSVHLKQRFLEDGAVDYIVKASAQAQNEALVARVKEILGTARTTQITGIDLEQFLAVYVDERSKKLFLDSTNSIPKCADCGSRSYVVTFSKQPQLPPEIAGTVVCSTCGADLDPEVA